MQQRGPERPAGGGAFGLIRHPVRWLDAERHEIDLNDLAESLRGMSRIIAVTGNLAATGRFVQHKDALSVRVVARPPEAHCFEIVAWLRWVAENPLTSATVSGLTVALITYVFSVLPAARRDEAPQRLARQGNRRTGVKGHQRCPRAFSTPWSVWLSRCNQRSSSCRSNWAVRHDADHLEQETGNNLRLDEADREALLVEADADITPQGEYVVEIVSLSMEKRSCKLI